MVSDYLIDLANLSGINTSDDLDESFNALKDWEIVESDDYKYINDELTYNYLTKTLLRLMGDEKDINYLIDNGYIKAVTSDKNIINKAKSIESIKKVVEYINNPEINNYFEYEDKSVEIKDYELVNNRLYTSDIYAINDIVYLKNEAVYKKVIGIYENYYEVIDADFSEIYETYSISGQEEINFEDAVIIPYDDDTAYVETSYSNPNYELLASKRHSFTKDGFTIDYSFKSSGIDARISKKVAKGPTLFYDISLSNVKPIYKWEYEEGKLKNAFFKVNFKASNEIGASVGKYDDYYLDLKDKSSNNFLNFVKYRINAKADEIEATIPICKVKTSIPNVPTAMFCMDIVAKIYVSGKVEIVFYNEGAIGFEIKEGNFRFINDVQKDKDFIIGSSARAVLGLNFNLEATNYRLMDIEFDGGIRAAVSSTMHLYNDDGEDETVESDVPYSILQELAKENKDVRVCGDLSLNWVGDVQLNTSATKLYKYGLSYKKTILDKSDQVFHNLTHIENWQFVKSCTRKSRIKTTTSSSEKINSNKITLKKYSVVLLKGESLDIPISSLPSGYTMADLTYYSNDTRIVTCNDGVIVAGDIGSANIEIKTKDDKYKAYINVLVSTG